MDQMSVQDARRRSRSKTPFLLRSQCDKENCTETDHIHGHEKKKQPTVQTITEELEQSLPVVTVTSSDVSVVPSSSSSIATTSTTTTSSTRTTRSAKPAKNDKSVEEVSSSITTATEMIIVSESFASSVTSSAIQTGTSHQKESLKLKKLTIGGGSKSSEKSSKISKSAAIKSTKEIAQNELNREFEQNASMRTSTPILGKSKQRTISPPQVKNGDLSDHIAYKEYKDAGEYWNKYPKTDYTYSELSPHRREIAPGVVAMPNMSRKSLEHHHERVNVMARSNPSQEAFIRARYQSSNYQPKSSFRQENYYDSQDEVDLTEFDRKRYSKSTTEVQTNIIRRMITLITSSIYRSWYRVTSIFRRSDEDFYYTRIEEEKGILRRIASSISSAILSVFRYLYIFISSVLFLDSWLLKSSNAENGNKKRFLLLLLILLPLLMLAAWNLAEEPDRRAFVSRFPLSLSIEPPIFLTSYGTTTSNFAKLLQYPFVGSSYQSSLTDHQYKDLLKHINLYIDNLIAQKTDGLKDNISRNDLKILIASIVNENIIHLKYELSDSEIEKIVSIVLSRLNDSHPEFKKSQEFTFSADHLMVISNIVKENVAQFAKHQNQLDNLKIDDILLTILSSPKMANLVDQRILNQLSPEKKIVSSQQKIIDELKIEIDSMKLKLNDKLKENDNLQNTLVVLQTHQNSLANQLNIFETEYKDNLAKVLSDLDLKLSDLNAKHYASIDDRIKLILLEIIGYTKSSDADLSNVDIKQWIHSIFVSKELLEEKLNSLNGKIDGQMKDDLNRSAGILMKNISDQIKAEVFAIVEQSKQLKNIQWNVDEASESKSSSLNEDFIRKIVKEALAVYDADKTGLVDYALESSGGEVLSTRCTENYRTKSAQISIFGIPLWYQTNTPRTAIAPTVQPGQCWAFQGFPGFLVLKLNSNVFVTGFTLEHIPKSLAPNGRIDSAPKLFTVWGLTAEIDPEPTLFGTYEYNQNGTSLQYFRVQHENINRSFSVVELRIESNHGNIDYTCLYRFRVHGVQDT